MNDLYPDINDPSFNVKIAQRKEFNDYSHRFTVEDAEKEAKRLCFSTFELNPHQQFVKSFLSVNTPYNSLLLFHGLGTGKTCSAIGVSEEMRNYMKQMGITKKIIIVASPNVQENFRQQLFDDRKMEKVGGVWNIQGCSGAHFLAEINPINLRGLSKEKIVSQVNRIINSYYLFMGYGEFANFISKKANVSEEFSEEQREKIKERRLKATFENRLVIIDEVHNIRNSDNKREKRVASRLDELVKYVHPLRLLLLSATPMYNDPREIVWLINLMNKNDGRSSLTMGEVFDKDGHFIISPDGEETGKALLMRKATGYISFLKGDNPYTFPYRIFPNDYKSPNSLKKQDYPDKSLLGGPLVQPMEYLDLFCLNTGSYQSKVYASIIQKLKEQESDGKLAVENMERFGYTLLQKPLEALNMSYPVDAETLEDVPPPTLVGIEGLRRCMNFKSNKTDYEYKPEIREKYGRLFSQKQIGKYSAKIAHITDAILSATGICLVYSQFLEGGVIPLALALEERGCKRFDGPNLLKDGPKKTGVVYSMITGSEELSPNNSLAVKTASATNNKDGSVIKIILISRAGSEGLDFANIRQVHILDPWYNTNRIEQTIGRAVRNCSHKNLPFRERNVMIFLYSTLLENKIEAADMYVYRVAELKAILIGQVTRALKQGAIDCILNKEQTNAAADVLDQRKRLRLSDGKTIDFYIGDKPFSQQCDYMESCAYECEPTAKITAADIIKDTFTLERNDTLIMKIKELFREHFFYKKEALVRFLTYSKPYSLQQIDYALTELVNDETMIIEDRYGRGGHLVNIGEYYIFQPLELESDRVSLFDRDRPIDYKRGKLIVSSSVLGRKEAQQERTLVIDTSSDKAVIAAFEEKYKLALTPNAKLKKSEKNWYKNAANAMVRLIAGGMKKSLLHNFIVSHIWDTASGQDKLSVLNGTFLKKPEQLTAFEKKLVEVIGGHLVEKQGIYIQDTTASEFQLYVLEDGAWKKGEKTDNDEFTPHLVKVISTIIKQLSAIYGFIIPFKETGELIFKTKITDQKRQSGARCDQASKKDTIKTLNMILDSVKRNEGCPSTHFDDDVVKNIGNIELCCYTELVLRCYNHHAVQGKSWFVNPEFAQNVLDILKN